MDLKQAVEYINNYRREESDPDLIKIQTCANCGHDFPCLASDVSLRKRKGIPPKCKLCAREERRIRGTELQRLRRQRLKQQK